MLFNSSIFLFYFLPCALIGYQLAARFGRRPVIGWLAFASVVFYSWWNWHFVFVLLGSMLLNFVTSKLIAASPIPAQKKLWLILGIALNLAGLFYFKYLFHLLGFFHSVGIGHHAWSTVALPLGISFFTFTQIGYLVDLSQGLAEPQNFVEFALFVSFFPHLIAGPILHHREMMPQFVERKDSHLQMDDMLVGLSWFVLGLAKKCILADSLGPHADSAFAASRTLGIQAAWLGIILYSLQLYFDFSGYSDMAIGLARMFSIRFPMNFNSPYKAANITEFWQRWNMTLTRYLTLYLYNPISLAVNRRRLRVGRKVSQKAARTLPGFLSMVAWPTMATMFLVGIWHGAGLQYIIFGTMHGAYLTADHLWRLVRPQRKADPRTSAGPFTRAASVLVTYVCVMLALVFFRANGTGDALHYLAGMVGLHGVTWHDPGVTRLPVLLAAVGLAIVWFLPNTQEILGQVESAVNERRTWLAWKPTWQWSLTLGVLFFIALLFVSNSGTFLYFQF
jgi:alginate O-acetyltransferase complex protein AlgI